MSDYVILVGKRLREARKFKKLYQKDIADILGLSIEAYGHYERGRSEISLADLLKVSNLTGVNAAWILTGEGRKQRGNKIDAEIDIKISGFTDWKKKVLLKMAKSLEEKEDEINVEDL